jgi:hypothetical protein
LRLAIEKLRTQLGDEQVRWLATETVR